MGEAITLLIFLLIFALLFEMAWRLALAALVLAPAAFAGVAAAWWSYTAGLPIWTAPVFGLSAYLVIRQAVIFVLAGAMTLYARVRAGNRLYAR